METLISRITSFFSLSKTFAITPAGIIAALALAWIVWPPHPADTFMEAHPNGAALADSRPTALGPPLSHHVDQYCNFKPKTLPEVIDPSPTAIANLLKSNQELLDSALDLMNRCVAYDNLLSLQDDTKLANYTAQLQVLAKDRDAMQLQYQKYETDLNPLRGPLSARYNDATTKILALQSDYALVEEDKRGRQANVALETVYQKHITDLLAEPGRLRPRQSYDDIVAGLGNHVLYFLLLSLLIGYVLDPVNAAIFGAMFDSFGRNLWNGLRRSRFPVVATKSTPPTPPPQSTATTHGVPEEEAAVSHTHRRLLHCEDIETDPTRATGPRYLFFPSYAIGQNIITQAQLDTLTAQYYSQSQLSFGLILPTCFLGVVLLLDMRVSLPWWIFLVLCLFCIVALLVGMDRLHKFNSELQMLIQSSYCVKVLAAQKQKQADAAAAAAAKKAADDATAAKGNVTLKTLSDSLDKLTELVQNLGKGPVNVNIGTLPPAHG